MPLLDLLLAQDRAFHRGMKFIPDEQGDVISLREAVNDVFAMLPSVSHQIAGNASIQSAVSFAGKDVDGWLLFHKQ